MYRPLFYYKFQEEYLNMSKKGSILTALLGAGVAAGASVWYFGRKRNMEKQKEVQPEEPAMTPEEELVAQMPNLIKEDRFQLWVQPVVDLKTGDIVGGEVLSRLDHPERGLVFPNNFLPAIEKAGLTDKFDHYVFGKTCILINKLTRQGIHVQYLSCNFCRMTLSEQGVVERLVRIADEYGVNHEKLALEITEQELETDAEQFNQNLRQLKEEGFRIFVDDLGAGVTSVRDLWSHPVDVAKNDRSLLLDAETERGRIAYRGLRNLAADLGCKVLCEGVETEEQRQFVQDVGCDYCQGFLFYRPMEQSKFMDLMDGISKE